MATQLSRLRRLYLQEQSSLLTIPNTTGTATMAVANYTPHTTFRPTLSTALLRTADKNGTRSREAGVAGRSSVAWTLQADLRSRGTADGLPPLAPILTSVFGAPATVRAALGGSITNATNASPVVITQVAHGFASGDVVRTASIGGNRAANGVWVITVLSADTYSLIGSSGSGAYTSGGTSARSRVLYRATDDILPFVAGLFSSPSTQQQMISYGNVTRQLTMRLGQDVANVSAEGAGCYMLDSDTFSSEPDVELQAGLAAFPSEPTGSLPADGGIIAGFTGRAVFGGSNFVYLRSVEVQVGTGNQLVTDNFGRYIANESEGDLRNITANVAVSKTDDAGAKALWAAFKSKAPVDFILQIGTAQFKTFVLQLKGIQLETADEDDGGLRVVRNYNNCTANGSAPGALDEIKLDIL
jgi:hypothetical protein